MTYVFFMGDRNLVVGKIVMKIECENKKVRTCLQFF